jgi:serpin B
VLHFGAAVMKSFLSRSALSVAVSLVASTSALVACSSDDTTSGADDIAVARSALPRDTAPNVSPADQTQLTSDNTAFAVDLYHVLRKDPEYARSGIFLSPHSISTALAMTYAGARGTTESEMAKTMHFTLPQDRVHPAFDWLDLALESRGQGATAKDGQPFRLRVTNSTWGQKDSVFEQPFLDRLAVSYGAGINLVDFKTNAEGARKMINGWVEKETETRIKDLIPPNKLTRETRFLLVNAVYFNAAWATKFEKTATADAPFTKVDGSPTTVSMMHGTAELSYLRGAGYDAVELPYDGGEMSMVIIVPEAGHFADFENALTASEFGFVLDSLVPQRVELGMPKFREEGAFGLKKALQDLGMQSAFGNADFSGLSTKEALQLTDVLHKTFLDIDEEGTEATAATAVIAGKTSAPADPPVKMTIDRPFFVTIIDRATKTPVFFGRVLEPKK